uniref:VQ domain-containing protein n=1 Tax=Oryza meridionalis TaxID=40149 RepID=A0A0E0E2I7_9ORYZ
MEVHGAASREQQQHGGGGVKVKFIETQFVSSDAASFKSVVQRLTGQSAPSPSPSAPPTAARPSRPRARAAVTACPAAAVGWAGGYGGGGLMTMAAPVKQEAAPPPNLEDLHELRDFSDLFYPTSAAAGGRRVDGGGYGYPYY